MPQEMTEKDALETCSGYVAYPDLKGHFPFRAVNPLLATGKYVIESSSWQGYVLRILSPQARAELAAKQERERHGGALSWLAQ